MKKSLQLIVASTMLMVLSYSCKQGTTSGSELVGNWKMNAVHSKGFDDQVARLSDQVKALSDSLGAAKDSASHSKFENQLNYYQHSLSELTARKDSSLKNSRWIFNSDRKFEDHESASKIYKGYWDYNPKTKMLTQYVPSDSLKVEVKNDTLTVSYDSLNHLIFVKSK